MKWQFLFGLVFLRCFAGGCEAAAKEPLRATDGPLLANDSARSLCAADYPSIQEAINSNPGRMIYLPPGDYEIAEKIRFGKNHAGLFGPGRIIQTNPDAAIIEIKHGEGVQLRDVILTRPKGKQETRRQGLYVIQSRNVVLENVQVLENRSPAGTISIRECANTQVRGCFVRNYMCISVDDRTASENYGYAFNCIDGTGISVSYSVGTLLQGNRVIEQEMLPTPEVKAKFKLGKFVKKNATKGALMSQQVWDAEYADNWHQGSAIIVTAPEVSDYTQILGNYIENAAQGIDIHSDHVIISQNIINNSFMGMKAMHGSKHVLIIGNQFSRNDLWSIGLMPGAASHAALPASAGKPAKAANVDGGSIIANNIISDFGYGHAHWIWGDSGTPIRFDTGQTPDNPPLSEVIIQGNMVYDTGRDQVLVDGVPKVLPLVDRVHANLFKRVPTHQLNLFYEEVVKTHPPHVGGTRLTKVRYLTQVQVNPPTVLLFAKGADSIPQAYIRFLLREFRDRYDFEGVPVRMIPR